MGTIICQTTSDVAGAEDASYRFFVIENGTSTEYMNIQAANAQILLYKKLNVNGNDIDNVQNIVHDVSGTSGALNFDHDQLQTDTIASNTTYSTPSNIASGRSKTVKLLCDGTTRTLTFPAWKFLGVKPTEIAANKTAVLTLTCFGTTDADIVAAYAVEA